MERLQRLRPQRGVPEAQARGGEGVKALLAIAFNQGYG